VVGVYHQIRWTEDQNSVGIDWTQDCGKKNIFTNKIAEIMAPYSNSNITDINEITGKFNGILENLCLAVCNELKSDKHNKAVDTNKLKDAITETEIRIERKYVDKSTAENVCNFIFVSNNFSPFKQEIDDRRNLDLQCVKPEDPDVYFQALGAEVDAPLFHQTLFTYLLNRDVPIDYDFVHTLPMTELKRTIQATYKNPFELFITRHWQLFVVVGTRKIVKNMRTVRSSMRWKEPKRKSIARRD
jgi:hypothetical protein